MNSSSQFLSRTMGSVSSRLMRSNDSSADLTSNNNNNNPSSTPSMLRPQSLSKKSWMLKRSGSVTKKASSQQPYVSSIQDIAFLTKQLTNVRDSKLTEQLFDSDLLSKVEFDNKGLTLDELHVTAVVLLERTAPRATFSDKQGLQLLFDFVSSVRAVYKPNPYHDFRHCVDVMQFSHILLQQEDVKQMLMTSTTVVLHPEETSFLMMVACLCHDAGHTGWTNAIHRSRDNDALVQRFGKESTLEKLHFSHCQDLVQRSKLLDRVLSDTATFLQACEELILATDMERHKSLLASFHVEPANQLLQVVIKMADISNVARDFEEAKCWAKRLEAECKEHPNALPVTVPLHQSVPGFANMFAMPLAEVFSEVGLKDTGDMLRSRILQNNASWKKEGECDV